MLRGVEQKFHMGSYRLQYAQLCILLTVGVVNTAIVAEGAQTYRCFLRQLTSVVTEESWRELTL